MLGPYFRSLVLQPRLAAGVNGWLCLHRTFQPKAAFAESRIIAQTSACLAPSQPRIIAQAVEARRKGVIQPASMLPGLCSGAPASNRRGQAVTPSITTKNSKDLTDKDYEVKIVGARWKELLAVRALFDSIHQELRTVNRNLNHDALRAPLRMAGNIQKPPESLILAITGVSGKPLLQSDRHSSPLNSHLDHIISIRPDYQCLDPCIYRPAL